MEFDEQGDIRVVAPTLTGIQEAVAIVGPESCVTQSPDPSPNPTSAPTQSPTPTLSVGNVNGLKVTKRGYSTLKQSWNKTDNIDGYTVDYHINGKWIYQTTSIKLSWKVIEGASGYQIGQYKNENGLQ